MKICSVLKPYVTEKVTCMADWFSMFAHVEAAYYSGSVKQYTAEQFNLSQHKLKHWEALLMPRGCRVQCLILTAEDFLLITIIHSTARQEPLSSCVQTFFSSLSPSFGVSNSNEISGSLKIVFLNTFWSAGSLRLCFLSGTCITVCLESKDAQWTCAWKKRTADCEFAYIR